MIKKLCILFCVFASVDSESCKAFQTKKEHLNKRLIGHEISEVIVKGHHDCVRECFYLSLCKSTDYHKRENTCKLNDADSQSVETTEFEDKPGAVFSDITEWPSGMAGVCGQRPCSDKQKCFPDKDGYQCIKAECGKVPTIENGAVVLDKAGGMLYMDTATVTCQEGYGPVKPSIQCQASGTWESVSCEIITDCKDMHQYFPSYPSGVYRIKLWQSLNWLNVYCDMDTDGGGWTVFQSRSSGSEIFYRQYTDYTNGFGDLGTEFWLGLKYTREMVSQGQTELRMDLTAGDGSAVYETFQNFHLGPNAAFTLHIDPGTGTAGDDTSLLGFSTSNGVGFSTYDTDRDHDHRDCAELLRGAWWYQACGGTNLNGEYVTPAGTQHSQFSWAGMIYHQWQGGLSLKTSKLMFRRV